MQAYECNNCDEVMGIKCTEEIDHCPCCGYPDSVIPTDKKIPADAGLAEDWEDEIKYGGCGAIYSVESLTPPEYCPNRNGQNG